MRSPHMLPRLMRFLFGDTPSGAFVPDHTIYVTPPQPAGPDVSALLAPLARPAIHLVRGDVASRSWAGGNPLLPREIPWPRDDGGDMQFLVRLSLAELHAAQLISWLPREGALLVFRSWSTKRHCARCSVVLAPDMERPLTHTLTIGEGREMRDVGANLHMLGINSLPPLDNPDVAALALDDAHMDAAVEAADAVFNGSPQHVAGHDMPIQVGAGRMEIECEEGASGRRLDMLTEEALAWRPLLQLDEDEELEFRWGRPGMLYIWVQTERAARGDFSACRMIMQT